MKNVLLVFGGMSYEHDISVVTASQIFRKTKIDDIKILPLYVTRDNKYFLYENKDFILKDFSQKSFNEKNKKFKEVFFVSGENNKLFVKSIMGIKEYVTAEVALIACHGGAGENGRLVSFLENFGFSCSAGNFESLAIFMNKFLFKQMMKGLKIPVVSGFQITKSEYENNDKQMLMRLRFLQFPVVIKPNNGGSSIGLFVVRNKESFGECLKQAFLFDNELIVEKFVENAREFNVAVIGCDSSFEVSEIDEPIKEKEVLTFADKYLNTNENGCKNSMKKGAMDLSLRKFPADIEEKLKCKLKKYAFDIAYKLKVRGVVRIDFLFCENTGKIYVCEVNAVPGSLSYYFFEKNRVLINDFILKLIEISKKSSKTKLNICEEFVTNILE